MSRTYVFFLLFLPYICHKANAQIDSTQPRLFIELEMGMSPIKSLGSEPILCYQGQLGLSYRLFSQFRAGLYGQTLYYYQNLNIANLDDKIIELSSIEYNTVGLSLAYTFRKNRLSFTPKLDLGYNFFIAKALNFDLDSTSFLDYRYLSLTPKLGLEYMFSPYFSLGVFGGYNLQITALKGRKTDIFDPSSFVVGIAASIGVGR